MRTKSSGLLVIRTASLVSGKGITSALIEIEDVVLTTIRRVIGLSLVGFDINLGDSAWDGKVIGVGWAAI